MLGHAQMQEQPTSFLQFVWRYGEIDNVILELTLQGFTVFITLLLPKPTSITCTDQMINKVRMSQAIYMGQYQWLYLLLKLQFWSSEPGFKQKLSLKPNQHAKVKWQRRSVLNWVWTEVKTKLSF